MTVWVIRSKHGGNPLWLTLETSRFRMIALPSRAVYFSRRCDADDFLRMFAKRAVSFGPMEFDEKLGECSYVDSMEVA